MIRQIVKHDIDKIMQLWLKGNTKAHPFISESYWLAQFNEVKEAITQAEVYVYEVNGEILGFIGLSGNYIAGIFVAGATQSKGIGRRLLDYVKGIKRELSLRVYQKNARAIAFYEREGFVIQSEDVDESTGESEFLMAWLALSH